LGYGVITMMGQKLRNIFVAKYLPILKRMGGVEIEEKTEEEEYRNSRENGGSYTTKDYEFEIKLPINSYYTVLFRDIQWDDGATKSWVFATTLGSWEAPQKMESEDWRKFYGRLNLLISRILAEMIAHNFRDARSYRERVILPNGVIISFKFTLSKLHVSYTAEGNNLTDIPVDLPKEGDIIEALTKALSLFLL
jgi:hypothetical protein